MKSYLKGVLPKYFVEIFNGIRQFFEWRRRGYLEQAPQFVKQNLLIKYGVPGAQWVETGTYLGITTEFLSERFPMVYSIEPQVDLYNDALNKFSGRNVRLFNGVSEDVMYSLLDEVSGDINFWLDGHYSAGITYRGDKDCPVEDELTAIVKNISSFGKVVIFIDDVRCFVPGASYYDGYPTIDYLVDWARSNGFNWRVEHDIFVMRNFS